MDIKIFDGTWPTVTNNTAYGYFENDVDFINDAPRIGKHIVYKLGFPIVDIEIRAEQIYTCFEDAIMTYSSEVNKYNIKENLLNVQGASTDRNLTHHEISTSLSKVITIAQEYGNEAGSGGNVDWKKGFLTTNPGQQIYDLDTVWANTFESGSAIEIKKVFHYEIPASSKYINPWNVQSAFGWNSGFKHSSLYMLNPVNDDMFAMQAIQFSQKVRKSAYSFWVRNNKVSIFPRPTVRHKIWFEYILKSDRSNPLKQYPNNIQSGSISGSLEETNRISDFSNIPYDFMLYRNINSPGRSWIREYAFALVKEILGNIRSKYQSLPIPDSEITLDGDTLRSEAQSMKDQLLEQLRDMLEQSSRRMQMEAKEAESEHLLNIMTKVPSFIYIG